ncbi:MAG: ribbon-helix-helix protein, CopG family [Chloroflexi bacterium]|nr:ribbon-helix-helix protein, CopG family [Chloroflexota bacterium]
MTTRRTTLAADSDDLDLLADEARRRGVSLAAILREAVEAEAARLRTRTRPRFGIASSDEGAARVAARDEHAPIRARQGS